MSSLSCHFSPHPPPAPRANTHDQLLHEISPKLIEYAAENAREMIFAPSKFPLMFQYIACFAKGDKTLIYEQLVEILGEEFIPCNVENMHMIEHKNGHFALKHILTNDKKLKEANEATFVEYLIAHLDPNLFSSWICCNKGAFILVSMIETEIAEVKNVVLSCAKQNLGKLKKYSFKGAQVLIEKLKQSHD
uniref:CPL domain-containing protein n=1 Tax=Romanomermis culicivorax TaxID=13658 RepID=A0A915IR46_ROMCU